MKVLVLSKSGPGMLLANLMFWALTGICEQNKQRLLVWNRSAPGMLPANQIFLDVDRNWWNKQAESINLEQAYPWHAHRQLDSVFFDFKYLWNRLCFYLDVGRHQSESLIVEQARIDMLGSSKSWQGSREIRFNDALKVFITLHYFFLIVLQS